MTGFNHGITGAVVAVVLKEPALVVPLAFMSHFVCDSLPHFGLSGEKIFKPLFNGILVADFTIAVVLMVLLGFWFPDLKWVIWAGMIAAASPDLMWAYYEAKKAMKKPKKLGLLARFHAKIQWSQTTPGLIVEALWFGLMLFVLSRLHAGLS
jgi:hypothetical protein